MIHITRLAVAALLLGNAVMARGQKVSSDQIPASHIVNLLSLIDPVKSKRYYMDRVPAATFKAAQERLNWLQMRLHPKARDLKVAMADYMSSLDQLHRASSFSSGTLRMHLERRDRVLGEAHKLGVDRKVLEEMMH
ncbi:MAG: hypothetical protein HZC54_11410 [Verrucomicrobia bacterium]|nr:hypothetical protein [Verrucomicrobiota bacterium]